MPLVTIYRRGISPDYVRLIKQGVREKASKELTVPGWPISEKSFSFVNHRIDRHEGDEMEYDAIVVIPVHNFPERVVLNEDAVSLAIKCHINELIVNASLALLNIEVMVGMYQLGWSGKP